MAMRKNQPSGIWLVRTLLVNELPADSDPEPERNYNLASGHPKEGRRQPSQSRNGGGLMQLHLALVWQPFEKEHGGERHHGQNSEKRVNERSGKARDE